MNSDLLRPGQEVLTMHARVPCRVLDLLGGGSQGEVYRAELASEQIALKWYRPAVARPLQRRALEALVRRGSPGSAFLWPLDLATVPTGTSFGYVMPLRNERFRGLADLVRRHVEPPGRVLATVGMALADAFGCLHTQGLCYRDISLGNVFFDPERGDVLVCDNDNVAVDGTAVGGVIGTPRFMAPEVVTGDALPSSRTDLFSLAVLLFTMLCVHHPFEGAREQSHGVLDLAAMRELYGERPLFVFDPDDPSNRPVPGVHQNTLDLWPLYPRALQSLFTQAFTIGVRDPINGRVRESQWREAMRRLRDTVLVCDACGGDAEQFWDPVDPWTAPSCWRCGRPLPPPVYLTLAGGPLVVSPGAMLTPHHLDPSRTPSSAAALGVVVRHPREPGAFGLRNLSKHAWLALGAAGTSRAIEPDATVRLAPGTRIDFGPSVGEVLAARVGHS